MEANATSTFEVRALYKSYPLHSKIREKKGEPQPKRKQALKNVGFTMTPGIYGLLGPNGAGKSTLLNIITGSLSADRGSVQWQGKSTRRLGKHFRSILGYMPQQQGLYPTFTGRRFLKYICALKEIPVSEVSSSVEENAARVHLSDELDKRLSAYSGGMKQRLLCASAMIGNPRLLILDEPTAGLDPKERVSLRNLMASLAEEKIIMIATHVVSDVERVAKEIILLREGEIADKGSPEELIDKYVPGKGLEEVYLHIFGKDTLL